jgi:hypothetical protein
LNADRVVGSPGGTRTPDLVINSLSQRLISLGLNPLYRLAELQPKADEPKAQPGKQFNFFVLVLSILKSGSPGGTRTPDLVINSHPLYRLSYRGTMNRLYHLINSHPLYRLAELQPKADEPTAQPGKHFV